MGIFFRSEWNIRSVLSSREPGQNLCVFRAFWIFCEALLNAVRVFNVTFFTLKMWLGALEWNIYPYAWEREVSYRTCLVLVVLYWYMKQQQNLFNGKAASFPASLEKWNQNKGCLEPRFPPALQRESSSEGREALKNLLEEQFFSVASSVNSFFCTEQMCQKKHYWTR